MAFGIRRRKKATEPASESEQLNLGRPSALDIYKQVASNARDELRRSSVSLAISGFAGGIFMGLSALGTAIAFTLLGSSTDDHFVAWMFYPLGFIVVILGRAQLFTENTLYPVALVLAEHGHVWRTLRLWLIVLPSNVCGALAFASLVTLTPALQPRFVDTLSQLGMHAVTTPPSTIFWSGVMGGWIIATVAWLVSGSHSITGSVMIIGIMTFVVGLGGFAHCIATSGEIISAVLRDQTSWLSYLHWLSLAVAGNVCGGVGMVTLLEYGQVISDQETADVLREGAEDRPASQF